MQSNDVMDPMMLAFVILNHGQGEKFLKKAMGHGVSGGLVSPGQGLLSDEFLNVLGLRHDRRDLILLAERKSLLQPLMAELSDHYNLDQPNHGIIFLVEARSSVYQGQAWLNEVKPSTSHQLLLLAVRHDQRVDYIHHLQELGVNGATYFTGRGLYKKRPQGFLGLNLPPQKDVILSVMPRNQVEEVLTSLEATFDFLDHPSRLLMTMDITNFSKGGGEAGSDLLPTEREVLISIVNEELEESYIQLVKDLGLNGGTSLLGHGTVAPAVARKLFNLNFNPQKKIFFTVDDRDKVRQAYEEILADPVMSQEHQGVYMTMPMTQAFGLYED